MQDRAQLPQWVVTETANATQLSDTLNALATSGYDVVRLEFSGTCYATVVARLYWSAGSLRLPELYGPRGTEFVPEWRANAGKW